MIRSLMEHYCQRKLLYKFLFSILNLLIMIITEYKKMQSELYISENLHLISLITKKAVQY